MERGSLGALDYQMTFPTQQAAAAGAGQGGGPINPQGYLQAPPKDPLAVREKLTSDYYNNYNLLQNVVKDALAQGLNPFEPDYSQEGGGLAFQTFQRAQAGLMYAANALANEFQAEEQMRPYVAQDKVRISQNANRDGLYASDPNSYYSTDTTPGLDQTNRVLGQETNSLGDQNRRNQLADLEVGKIDQQVTQGLISPERGEYLKAQIVPNRYVTNDSIFNPRNYSRGRGGLSQEDVLGRAELIKQVKRGILTKDQTPLNMLKLVPGVEDIEYVNTGDKVGLQIFVKGQGQPSFIDLSEGKGEGDINAFLNRIEGQKNVPNEAVFKFDTAVKIPKSNARAILDDVKTKLGTLPDNSEIANEVFPKLQEIAAQGGLTLPTGEPIVSLDLDIPRFFGDNKLIVTYYPVKNGKVDYSKKKEKEITDKSEIENFVEANANYIAPEFGGGFIEDEPQVSSEQQKAQELINKYRR